MGRLSGFSYSDIVARLRRLGFEFERHAKGSHEIWHSPLTKRNFAVPGAALEFQR